MNASSQNPDVIVIGAGVAGLSAAQSLLQKGLAVVVLEAAAQPGGRCITDNSAFSVPFDRGGTWLHSANINPLARIAEDRGEKLHKTPWVWTRVNSLGSELTTDEVAEYRAYQDQMWDAANNAGQKPEDATIASVLPESPWKSTARHSIAQMLSADADVTSVKDTYNYDENGGDWLVAGGIGNFIAGLHRDVQVHFNCPAHHIDYSGQRVRVGTSRGELEADQVVLTVSTGVLAADKIRFTPELPSEKRAAIAMLPLGLLNKVGIEFEPDWKGALCGQMADYHNGDTEFCSLLFGFFNTGLATGFVAGRFADALETEGAGAATAYCREALRSFFGSDVDKSILRTCETSWRSNAHTLGAYSYARQGGTGAREILAEPLAERLFFAGEAVMKHAYSTLHGAYLSGKNAAEEIARKRSNRG